MDIIKRSEIYNMATRLEVDPNEYMEQIARTYPRLVILNDLSIDESIF